MPATLGAILAAMLVYLEDFWTCSVSLSLSLSLTHTHTHIHTHTTTTHTNHYHTHKPLPHTQTTTTHTKVPMLLKTDMSSGHFSASDRYKLMEERSIEFAFVSDQLGCTKLLSAK